MPLCTYLCHYALHMPTHFYVPLCTSMCHCKPYIPLYASMYPTHPYASICATMHSTCLHTSMCPCAPLCAPANLAYPYMPLYPTHPYVPLHAPTSVPLYASCALHSLSCLCTSMCPDVPIYITTCASVLLCTSTPLHVLHVPITGVYLFILVPRFLNSS